MAPRRKWIDRKLLKELCLSQCSNEEIAGALRISWDTLQRRYAEPIKIWRGQGPMSIRRKLFVAAETLSTPAQNKASLSAAIFYLKNYGGMADVTRDERKPLEFGSLPTPEDTRTASKPN